MPREGGQKCNITAFAGVDIRGEGLYNGSCGDI